MTAMAEAWPMKNRNVAYASKVGGVMASVAMKIMWRGGGSMRGAARLRRGRAARWHRNVGGAATAYNELKYWRLAHHASSMAGRNM